MGIRRNSAYGQAGCLPYFTGRQDAYPTLRVSILPNKHRLEACATSVVVTYIFVTIQVGTEEQRHRGAREMKKLCACVPLLL